MTTSLTIRLPQEQREALKRHAERLQKTESQVLREMIEREITEVTLLDRVGSLAGSLDSSKPGPAKHPLKETIRQRNWRS